MKRWIGPALVAGGLAYAVREENRMKKGVGWGRRSRIPTGTIHTGRFNDLGDELVVFPGRSDWGEQGWFVGEQVNHPGREPFVTPKVFFRGAEGKDHALDSARTEEFWGYPEGRSARGRRSHGYNYKSIRAGDYRGAGSSKQLVKDMIFNMRRAKTSAERSHAAEQVRYAEAARSITSRQAQQVMNSIGSTGSSARGRRAGPPGYEVDDFGSPIQWKAAWDDDFRAGFAAGKKMMARRGSKFVQAWEAYRRGDTSQRHGSEWVSGYNAAVDLSHGGDSKVIRRAEALGLIKKGSAARGRRALKSKFKVGDRVKFRGRWGWEKTGQIVGKGGTLAKTPIWIIEWTGATGRVAREHILQGDILAVVAGSSARGRRAKAPGKLWKRVKGVRIYRDVDWDQYVVAPDLTHEAGWYHTDDREDAVQTAGWIAENEPHAVKP